MSMFGVKELGFRVHVGFYVVMERVLIQKPSLSITKP